MKNPADSAEKLAKLLEQSTVAEPPAFDQNDDPIAVLIQSFLLWESTTSRACKAYAAVRESFIDVNELRVSLPHEIDAIIGYKTDTVGIERAQRLRATLNHIFKLEHDVTLEHLVETGKRDVRRYLEALEGMTPYVASRTALLAFDAHAIPVDQQLQRFLIAKKVIDEEVALGEMASWMARHIKASEGRAAHFTLQSLAERYRGTSRRKSGGGGGGTRTKRKSTKKGTTKTGNRTPRKAKSKTSGRRARSG